MFLNGSLQLSSIEEYCHHEPLTQIPATHAKGLERGLMIGGGDGVAARELSQYAALNEIAVVDIDAAVSSLSRNTKKYQL